MGGLVLGSPHSVSSFLNGTLTSISTGETWIGIGIGIGYCIGGQALDTEDQDPAYRIRAHVYSGLAATAEETKRLLLSHTCFHQGVIVVIVN